MVQVVKLKAPNSNQPRQSPHCLNTCWVRIDTLGRDMLSIRPEDTREILTDYFCLFRLEGCMFLAWFLVAHFFYYNKMIVFKFRGMLKILFCRGKLEIKDSMSNAVGVENQICTYHVVQMRLWNWIHIALCPFTLTCAYSTHMTKPCIIYCTTTCIGQPHF